MKRTIYIILLLLTLSPVVVAQQGDASMSNRVVIGGEYFYVHTVNPGETLFSLSRKYGVSQGDIIKNNPHTADGLKAGEAIKIPAPEPEPLPRNIRNRTSSNRRVEVHTVNQGETAYSIAKRYAVTVNDLVESNPGLDPARIEIGQRILIPRDLVGSSTQSEIDSDFSQYTEALSEVTDGWNYHLVKKDETLYTLTRRWEISEDSLRLYNPIELANGLKAGSMLRYPAPGEKRYTPEIPSEQKPDEGEIPPFTFENQDSKPFDKSKPLNVSLVLPFTVNGQQESNMGEYYKGTLLALEDLKAEGVSVNLSVFDTQRSLGTVREILKEDEMTIETDLIIGPRSDDDKFDAVSRFAYRERIPVVSPLSIIDSRNPFLFEARPAPEHQYDKLKPFLTPDHNVVWIIPSTGVDATFKNEIEKLLPPNAVRVNYSRESSASAIRNALSRDKENIIIIPTDSESITDAILNTVSTIQNYTTSTTGRGYPIRIIGSSQWARFRNNDKEFFFKLGVMYTTLYYADRTNPAVASFDHRYLSAFGTLPSVFSYRGYDVAKLFIMAIHEYGDRYGESINRVNTPLLQVSYHFRQTNDGKWINDEWALIRHRSDYIIEVK